MTGIYYSITVICVQYVASNLKNSLFCVNIYCSMEDFSWMKSIFWKDEANSRLLDIEREYGFRFMIGKRDFVAGRTIYWNIINGIMKSRRAIFILSR